MKRKKIRKYGILLALDVRESEKALKIVEETAEFLDGVKIGIPLALKAAYPTDIFIDCKEISDLPIIADFKVADIGFYNERTGKWEGTNNKIVEELVTEGNVDYVICHTFPGIASLQECVETAHEYGAYVLTLPCMTHEGAELFFEMPISKEHVREVIENHLGIDEKTEKMLEKCQTVSDVIVFLGEKIGVDGYIGPANKPDVLKRYREFTHKLICTPGIGRQAKGKDPYEQMKSVYEICGENSAVIIGSAIYNDKNPKEAAKMFKEYRDEIVEKWR